MQPMPWPRTMATFVGSFVLLVALARALGGLGVPVGALVAGGGILLAVRAAAHLWAGAASEPAVAALFLALAGVSTFGAFPVAGTIALVGVLAVAWLLADAIARTGRLHGASTVFAMIAWIGIVTALRALGAAWSHGTATPLAVAGELSVVLPLMLALVGGLLLPSARWPALVGPLEALSPLDLVLETLTIGLVAAGPFRAAGRALGVPGGPVTALVATVVVLAVGSAYVRHRVPGPRDPRLIPPLILLPALALGALWAGTRG